MTTVTVSAPPSPSAASVDAPELVVTAVSDGSPSPLPVTTPKLTVSAASASSTPTAAVSFTNGPSVAGWGARIDQVAPASTWHILVPGMFDRVPAVDIYLSSGELVLADVVATVTDVYITFPSPYSGFVVLT